MRPSSPVQSRRNTIRAEQTVGTILAGGRGSRFGAPKCLARLGRESLVERVLSAHRATFAEMLLVTREPDLFRDLRVRVITDLGARSGPLGGIQAALTWARENDMPGICCTPCDAPFLEAGILRRLDSARVGDYAVIPRSFGPLGYEPLFAWYSSRALRILEERLAAGALSLHGFIAALPAVRFLSIEEVSEVADPERVFFNVNTVDELELARRKLREDSRHEG